MIQDKFYFIAGSKNVHLIFRTEEDLELYKDSRFMIAKKIGSAWLRELETMDPSKASFLLQFLHNTKLTMIWEILFPDYQHVVDLSYLDQPQLKFLTFTLQYCETNSNSSLSAFSPDTCITFARHFGLETAEYETIRAEDTEERMTQIRQGTGYEGEVLYFLDSENNTIGLLKKKTAWYVLLRAIREKMSHVFAAFKKNPGAWTESSNNSHLVKLNRRLAEIQRWLQLSDEELMKWKMLGKSFQHWLITKLLESRGDIERYSVRGNFPQLWKAFNTKQDITENNTSREDDNTPAAVATGNILEEPRGSSPSISIPENIEDVHIGAFIVRKVDLLGKNLKKVTTMINKTHSKVCDNKKLAHICFHDLDKLKKSVPISLKQVKVDSLIDTVKDNLKQQIKTVAKDEELVLYSGSDPLSCRGINLQNTTEITESTENIFVEILATNSETLEKVFKALILNLYHLGIKLDEAGKSVHIEKTEIRLWNGEITNFPQKLPEL